MTQVRARKSLALNKRSACLTLAAALLLTAGVGCRVHMPNTGVVSGEYTSVSVEKNEKAVATAGIAASGVVDKLAEAALKLLAHVVDRQLEALQDKYQGSCGRLYAQEGNMAAAPHGLHWTFIRGVRFPAGQLEDRSLFAPGLSPPVVAFFKAVEGKPEWEIDPNDRQHLGRHGWYADPDGKRHLQFVTMKLQWDTVASKDGTAFRVLDPRVSLWASKALMPGWDEVQEAICKATGEEAEDIFGLIAEAAGEAERRGARGGCPRAPGGVGGPVPAGHLPFLGLTSGLTTFLRTS